jgi:hypothetical protein
MLHTAVSSPPVQRKCRVSSRLGGTGPSSSPTRALPAYVLELGMAHALEQRCGADYLLM